MSEPAPDPLPTPRARRLARHFRWQALFEKTADPLFLLNRRGRLLFVNRAWEALSGITAADAADLVCRRPRPASPGDAWEDVVQHALTPPAEVLQGAPARVRRLLPGREVRQWWEVEFLPLRSEAGGHFLLGRVVVLPTEPLSGASGRASAAPLPERLANLRQKAAGRCGLELWADSPVPGVRRLVAQARLAAQVTAPVLIVGEAGTGKQTLARAIHYLGSARERAFAALDCARLPAAHLAAVLFAEAGSPHHGSLGTIYLRSPEYLAADHQARLCSWPVEGTGRPRLMAGSRLGLDEAVRSGRLLPDLACALATLVLEVPPLRERRADLEPLMERLLARANAEASVRVTGLAPDAWEVVRAHLWPGNVRELYHALATAQGRSHGERITAADLPAAVRQVVRLGAEPVRAVKPLSLDLLLEQAERRLIELALRRAGGNVTRAAASLGVWRQRLKRRMEALGLAGAEGQGPEGDEAEAAE